MKRTLQFGILALLCISLYGCPYESAVPISGTKNKIDTRLLGTWQNKKNKDNKVEEYTISKKSDYLYSITGKEWSLGHVEISYNTGHLSYVNQLMFLNLKNNDTGSKYAFYEIRLDEKGKTMTATPLSEKIKEDFKKSEDLYQWLTRNLGNDSVYDHEASMVLQKLK